MKPSLEQLWNGIGPSGPTPTFRRVDDTHPLDLYIGVDQAGSRMFLLLTAQEPPPEGGFPRGLEIERGRRADGRWALTIRLRFPELSKLFSHLCEDLVEASRGCPPSAGGQFVVERIARWERLLARGRQSGMDEREYRGLVAELIVLQRFLAPFVGIARAIAAWVGPLDADQDFRLDDRLVEVKSARTGSLTVTISTAEQLDVHDSPLTLAVVPIGLLAATGASEGTLLDLIGQIRDAARDDSEALQLFDERLAFAAYDPSDEWAKQHFTVGRTRFYRVAELFPRIIRSSISPQIRSVRYELDLSGCRDFEISNIGD